VLYRAVKIGSEAQSQRGPTAPREALDIDRIIAAHYKILKEEYPRHYMVIATKNIKYLSRFSEARDWRAIKS